MGITKSVKKKPATPEIYQGGSYGAYDYDSKRMERLVITEATKSRGPGVRGSLKTLCRNLHGLGQFITSGEQKPTPFTIQEVLAEKRIALLVRLASAILGVAITLADILTQILKHATTLTTPLSAPGRSSTAYANLQIVRLDSRGVI